MRDLEAVITDKAFTNQKFAVGNNVYSVEKTDNFEYIDPVDGSVSRNQVSFRFNWLFEDFFLVQKFHQNVQFLHGLKL